MISKIDLAYADGQTMLSEETTRQCIFAIIGEIFSGCYQFKNEFYGLTDIPTFFQEKTDRTQEYCTPARLVDIIVVTRGDQKDHVIEIIGRIWKIGKRLE